MRNSILLIILFGLNCKATACSFAPGYDEFITSPLYVQKEHPLITPKASVASIKRGYDDGNRGSCSDAGIIKIKFESGNPIRATGYKLKILEGSFESHVIPDYEVMPSRYYSSGNSITFFWLDGSYNDQESINFVLEIIAVSPEGDQSKPYKLRINHAGGKSN